MLTYAISGLKPNPPCSWADYTVPVVRFSDGSTWMDSAVIANELESRYPEPSLRLNPNLEKEAQGAMGEVFMSLVPYLLPLSAQIVALEDMNWFKEDRAKRFGMTVDEAFHTHKDGSSYFEAAKPGFEKVVQVLKAHKIDQGPFILGSQPCYADFYLVATLQMFSQIGEEGYEEFIKYAPAELRQLHEACREWTVRQD